ncbi:hypothetical protein [Mycobacterium hubeiense]|uniref:hypothetical protein n=1 Tax=Mycobacterium hubeiense TaxID=1867256 RepID=UPI001E3255D7|nr:hypothetical protein [Mycobacterium sp. QGD 101]
MITIGTTATYLERPVRSHVELCDPDAVCEFLESTYGARLHLSLKGVARRRDKPLLTHTRTDAGPFAIDQVQIPAN